jgi:hypothetical protein
LFLPDFCQKNCVVDKCAIEKSFCNHSKKCQVCKVTKENVSSLIADQVSWHNIVRASGKYNFEKCRIPVNDKFDIEFLRRMLGNDYKDLLVCDLLRYGFPIGIQNLNGAFDEVKVCHCKNHSGARNFPDDINSYLAAEKRNGAIMGPFSKNPFCTTLKVSPLNSVPKKDTSERRVILDLSMPKGNSVNTYINKNQYLGEETNLIFPRVDDFAKLVRSKGSGCLMFKKDLRKAYRQIPICPHDYNLVAFHWKKHIFCDTVLSMGLSSAAFICQRVTNAIAFIMYRIGLTVVNYLDDFAGVEKRERAWFAYNCLESVLEKSGLEESKSKACLPSEKMIFLGVLFNSLTMTMEVTEERLIEIRNLVEFWLKKDRSALKEVQSLIGKLNFVAACVRPGRVFISRLINWLSDIYKDEEAVSVLVPEEVRKDLLWWHKFLDLYNGVSILHYDDWSCPDGIFSTDACLTGSGGYFNGKYFHVHFSSFFKEKNYSICVLELLGIIIGLRLWNSELKGKSIVVNCDNEAVCLVINTGRARCRLLQEGLREVCFLAALAQCQIRCVHVPGESNRIADCLSRWDQDPKYQRLFFDLTSGESLEHCQIDFDVSSFLNNW